MSAATEQAPVVVSFATINDGLVLRWYVDEAGYTRSYEVASASRNRAWFREEDVSQELWDIVHQVHRRLRDDVYGGPFGSEDRRQYAVAEALATHRTKGLFSRDLLETIGDNLASEE